MNNKVTNNFVKRLGSQMGDKADNFPYAFKQLVVVYNDFVRQMDKSDFANSPRRYMGELTYLKSLKKFAQEHNLTEELKNYSEKEAQILKKLKDSGITFND